MRTGRLRLTGCFRFGTGCGRGWWTEHCEIPWVPPELCPFECPSSDEYYYPSLEPCRQEDFRVSIPTLS
jgi:hypothetical protein